MLCKKIQSAQVLYTMTTTSQLFNGNCLEILKQVPNASIDLVIADLPYGQTSCEWDTKIDLSLLWAELKRVGKENTAYIFFCTTKFGYDLIRSNEKWFRYDLVWHKPGSRCGFLNARKMPMRDHEMIYVFYNKLPTYNIADNHTQIREIEYTENKLTGVYRDNKNPVNHTGGAPVWDPRLPHSIIVCPVDSKKQHLTEKPQGILEWLIKYYSLRGGSVLDPTMGCGSTGVACRTLGRNFVGIEMNTDFFNTAMQRLAA